MSEQPIGRIEYLNSDGTVSSSWEFTRAREFEAVIWRNYDYDFSFRAVAYRNQEGKTIPLDFLDDIEPPVSLRVLDYDQWHKDTYKPSMIPEPVGCIEYLGPDGKSHDRTVYIDPQLFEKDIRECAWCGTPISVSVYQDQDSHTIPLGFIQTLDPPVRVNVVDYAQWHKVISQEPVENHQSFDDMFSSIRSEREKLPTSAPVRSLSLERER